MLIAINHIRQPALAAAIVLSLLGPTAVSAADAPGADFVVSADGTGTHATVQAAIDAAPAGCTSPFVIVLKPGAYGGHVVVPEDKPNITLRGEAGAEATEITGGLNLNSVDLAGAKLATPDTSTVLVRAADFTAEDITIANSTTREERIQALAIYITGDRAVFRRCRFLGWQDTVRADAPKGAVARQYFEDCYITGQTDFIYAAGTAVFSRCHIHCRADGWITAASTQETARYGYVFLDCVVTAAPEATRVYLGRPWRDHAAVAFIRTELPEAIAPEGWHIWDRSEAEATVRYLEYASTGPGAHPSARVSWARNLTDAEAVAYTIENVLGEDDGWNPATPNGWVDSAADGVDVRPRR